MSAPHSRKAGFLPTMSPKQTPQSGISLRSTKPGKEVPRPKKQQSSLEKQVPKPVSSKAGQRGKQTKLVAVADYKFSCVDDKSLTVSYFRDRQQFSLTIDTNGQARKLPSTAPFSVDDCAVLLVGLGAEAMPPAQQKLLYEYLAFVFGAFNIETIGNLLAHIARKRQLFPADTLQRAITALETVDPDAAELVSAIGPQFDV